MLPSALLPSPITLSCAPLWMMKPRPFGTAVSAVADVPTRLPTTVLSKAPSRDGDAGAARLVERERARDDVAVGGRRAADRVARRVVADVDAVLAEAVRRRGRRLRCRCSCRRSWRSSRRRAAIPYSEPPLMTSPRTTSPEPVMRSAGPDGRFGAVEDDLEHRGHGRAWPVRLGLCARLRVAVDRDVVREGRQRARRRDRLEAAARNGEVIAAAIGRRVRGPDRPAERARPCIRRVRDDECRLKRSTAPMSQWPACGRCVPIWSSVGQFLSSPALTKGLPVAEASCRSGRRCSRAGRAAGRRSGCHRSQRTHSRRSTRGCGRGSSCRRGGDRQLIVLIVELRVVGDDVFETVRLPPSAMPMPPMPRSVACCRRSCC